MVACTPDLQRLHLANKKKDTIPCSCALTRVLCWRRTVDHECTHHAFTDTTFESNYCGCECASCPNEYIRNSNQVCRICHVRLCLSVAFARMSDIIYIPAACRLGGTGPVVCLLDPFTWILKARSASSACTTGESPSCAGGSVTQPSRAGRIRVRSGP